MSDEGPGLDPAQRYELLGDFDLGAYESDLVEFPEFFDANGWPLYGAYDRYALANPVSGISWLDSPRLTTRADYKTDYPSWFELAQEFETTTCELWQQVAELKRAVQFVDEFINHLTARGVMDPKLLYEAPFTDFHRNGVEGVFDPADAVRLVQILRAIHPKVAA